MRVFHITEEEFKRLARQAFADGYACALSDAFLSEDPDTKAGAHKLAMAIGESEDRKLISESKAALNDIAWNECEVAEFGLEQLEQ